MLGVRRLRVPSRRVFGTDECPGVSRLLRRFLAEFCSKIVRNHNDECQLLTSRGIIKKKIGRGKGAARWVERLNIHHGFAERFPIGIFFHDVIRPRSWADKRLSPALVRKRGNGTVSGHSIVRRKFGTRFPLLYGRFFNRGTLDCPRSWRIFSPLVRADSRLSEYFFWPK